MSQVRGKDSKVKEVWKIIPDWPAYEASSLGRLRRTGSQRVLKLSVNLKGYKIAGLSNNGRRSTVTVAKAVALAFIGPRPDGLQINHIDGIKANNRPENLEYCTASHNNKHAFRLGLNKGGKDHGLNRHPEARLYGSKAPSAKFTEDQVREIRKEYADGKTTYIDLAVRFGVHRRTILRMVNGTSWPHVKEGLRHSPKKVFKRISATDLVRLMEKL